MSLEIEGLPWWFRESASNAEDPGSTLGQEDPLKKGMTTHSRILAWEIPWTEKPGGLQSISHKESDTTERQIHTHLAIEIWDSLKLLHWRHTRIGKLVLASRHSDLIFFFICDIKRVKSVTL